MTVTQERRGLSYLDSRERGVFAQTFTIVQSKYKKGLLCNTLHEVLV